MEELKGFITFLKHVHQNIWQSLEWDQVVPLACASYNFFPNEHSKESPFFLMFGRDPIVPLNSLLRPPVRYLHTEENILSSEAFKDYLSSSGNSLWAS